MLPRKICFVGLQILLTTHIAQTFVLLTANVDDVKKLARKLLSDKFAEKLVEIISKAMAPNVSEENEANADEIQQISDNEVLDQTRSRQTPKPPMRTTPRHGQYERESKEYARPSHYKVKLMGKVTSKYAITDLRDEASKEFSLYRNPADLALVKPMKPKYPTEDKTKLPSILRENPQQPYVASKKDYNAAKYELFNIERKKPKISYQKSKLPERSENYNYKSQYAYANMMGRLTESNRPVYPTTDYKNRRPKVEMKQYAQKERNQYFSGEDERKPDIDKQRFNLIIDHKKANNNDTLHIFVQNEGRLEELSTKRDRGEFDFAPRPRKPKDRSKDERYVQDE